MKKALLFLVTLLSFISLNAQIEYVDYGPDSWVIPINSNTAVDVEGDGLTDFYINSWNNELGFEPVFISGCLGGTSEFAQTSFGSRELKQYEIGDLILVNGSNLYDFIDDDRGSAYQVGSGFAEGWEDLQDEYIGFIVFPANTSVVRHGWLRMAVDETNQTVIIKEMAFTEEQPYTGDGGITVGDKGTTAVNNLDKVLGQVLITPNPANELAQINFNYTSTSPMSIHILNNNGQVVFKNNQTVFNGTNKINIQTADWASGTYFIHFKNEEGVHTERLVVKR